MTAVNRRHAMRLRFANRSVNRSGRSPKLRGTTAAGLRFSHNSMLWLFSCNLFLEQPHRQLIIANLRSQFDSALKLLQRLLELPVEV